MVASLRYLYERKEKSSRYLWNCFATCRTRVTISSFRQWGRSWSIRLNPPRIHSRFPTIDVLPRKKITCTRSEHNNTIFFFKAQLWQWKKKSLKENSLEMIVSNNCEVTLVAEVMPTVRTGHLIASIYLRYSDLASWALFCIPHNCLEVAYFIYLILIAA